MGAHKIPVSMGSDDSAPEIKAVRQEEPEAPDVTGATDTGLEIAELKNQVKDLAEKLTLAQQQAARAQADYQNLHRRTQEDRIKLVKLAARELVTDLLEPLSHLNLAAAQLNDPGLTMVVKQLAQRLEQNGLRQLEVLGKPFDVRTMEATEILDEGDVEVIKVVTPGYELNGEVIAHAKVVLGKKK